MVIYAAVGGRMSLVGAVYGTLLVNAGKTYFSESFPDLWLFLMAGLFIGVATALPMGVGRRSEEHTSELPHPVKSYAGFCFEKKKRAAEMYYSQCTSHI